MTEKKVAHAIVDTLRDLGVGFVAGIPGGGMMPILDAMYHQKELPFILVRHEQAAAQMAHAYAKATGKLAACLVTKSPGATNLPIGVTGAYIESAPMLVITCGVPSAFEGRGAFEEMDFVSFFRPITKWSQQVNRADRVPEFLRAAVRAAMTGRKGPAHLTIPADFPDMPYTGPTLVGLDRTVAHSLISLDPESVQAAANLLVRAERPAFILGGGVEWADAGQEAMALAETLGAPIVLTWQKKSVPDSHPLNVGAMGTAGTVPAQQALKTADLIFAIGCRFSEFATDAYRFQPPEGTKLVHLDIDPQEIGRIYPADLGLVADAKGGLAAILSELRQNRKCQLPSHLALAERNARVQGWKEAWQAQMNAVNWDAEALIQPLVLREVQACAGPNTIVTVDSGNFIHYASRYWHNTNPRSYLYPTGGTMGFGLPGALGAKFAHPDRTVVCLVGDGGFAMTLQELETAVRERLPVLVVVLNNMALGNIKIRQQHSYQARIIGSTYGNPDFAAVARAFGCHGQRVERRAELRPAIDEALQQVRAGRPAVLDILVDPEDNCTATIEHWW